MNYIIPEYIKFILNTLQNNGFDAYLVGGCVRDILMGRKPNDYDITTSAKPNETKSLFNRTVPTGEKYGTVTVLYGSGKAEVTTFRCEGGYTDLRRPENVSYVSDIKEDLSRRDFTVNAMAMDINGKIIDIFGGREDMKRRLLRTVGDANERFSEDALRMFRAVRFSSQLGFSLDDDILSAIKLLSKSCEKLSAERIRAEVIKTLISDAPQKVSLFTEYGLLSKYTICSDICDMSGLKKVKKDTTHRLSAYCMYLESKGLIESSYSFLKALGFSEKRARQIQTAISILDITIKTDEDMRRALYKYGKETILLSLSLRKAKTGEYPIRRLNNTPCFSLDDLSVKPNDLIAIGIKGADIGKAQRYMMDSVLSSPENNNREILLEILRDGGYYI